ncbi:MAG: hypothetical protein ACJ739_12680 [Acidimicrobiales bacterium]
MFVVVALLLAFGGASAAATTSSHGSPETGDHGGPKHGECEDGQDNDQDGLTDADDPACQQPGCLPSSQTPQKCDEADVSPENPEAGNCADGIDNDNDGLIDSEDPDCGEAPEAGNCANGIDDDEDGDIDSADSDCQGEDCVVDEVNTCDESTPPDTETSCDNGVDDDGDGLVDEDDPDCQGNTVPENPGAGNCDDGVDNDGDGLTDADDPDCQAPVVNLCTGAAGDPGLLTDDTLGQTLYDSGLDALSPLTEDPERNGAISGPLGDALTDTPLEPIGDEASCAVDLLLDEGTFPDL